VLEGLREGAKKEGSAVVTLLLHCCHTVVTLLLHCCYTVVTLLLHCCCTVVALLSHGCYHEVVLEGQREGAHGEGHRHTITTVLLCVC
jgi:hypothetical protein